MIFIFAFVYFIGGDAVRCLKKHDDLYTIKVEKGGDNMSDIHMILKEIRIERGMTQEEVADQIGLTRQAISGYESGRRQPGIDILMKLAEIYDVSMDAILYGNKEFEEKRKVKRIAIIVVMFFCVLQILMGLLTTLSSVVFPLEEGRIPSNQIIEMKKHFELLLWSDRIESLSFIILICGFFIILGMDLRKKNLFSWKEKMQFFFVAWGVSCIIAFFWSVVNPVYGIMDYMVRGPVYFTNILVILLIEKIVLCLKQK